MTKKIIFTIFGIFTIFSAYAAQIVNVEYIHQLINQKWDITLNYSPELRSEKAAANMKYLLTAIDVANEILNGEPTTDYGNGEFATTRAVDTIATNTAVDTLVKKPEKYKFSATVDLSVVNSDDFGFGEPMTSFGFMLGAAGTFYIDWGDGTEEVIEKTNTDPVEYSHDYGTSSGVYIVKIGGNTSEYSDDELTPAISFGVDYEAVLYRSEVITAISGSLGAIFPTLSDGSQPRFCDLFVSSGIAEIPSELFDGIHGAPVSDMFSNAFYGLYKLTSIPENLFVGINGAPADGMFNSTFASTPITSIPENLFAGISGAPASYMFEGTFSYTGLTSIPEDLFAGISGAPVSGMFNSTFADTSITSIPENLFAGISGPPASYMFNSTFYNTQITSIPDGLFAGINGTPASNMFDSTFESTPITGIPDGLFAGINGTPASNMFSYTFQNTNITSIPENLFAGIKGAPASLMFHSTFSNTPITSIPSGLFAGIKGAPASLMFHSTFQNTNITSIPSGLFAGIDTTAPLQSGSFFGTFNSCSALTGPSARINGKYLYEIWPNATFAQVGYMYYNATGLTDYANIPINWK